MWDESLLATGSKKIVEYIDIHVFIEHRQLEYGEDSQLELITEYDGNEHLRYIQKISKNKKFGLKCLRMDSKICDIYPRKDNSTRYPIFVYQKYLSHRPENNSMKGRNAFYRAYIPNPESNVWYKASPFTTFSQFRKI